MKKFFLYAVFVLTAVAAGGGVAVYRITHPDESIATIVNGTWMAHRTMDLGKDKLFTAQIAVATLYALNPSEVIYMVADKDADGNKLNAANEYVISGNRNHLNARYWSITLYADDYFLIPNDMKKYSFNKFNTACDDAGNFKIAVSKNNQSENWLPLNGEGQLYFLLRLYHADKTLYENLETIELPEIEKVK
jgi:hypothetical protein